MDQDIDDEIKKLQKERQNAKASLVGSVSYDTDLYETEDKYAGYDTELKDEEEDETQNEIARPKLRSFTAPTEILKEIQDQDDDVDPMAEMRPSRKIADREDEYHARRFNRIISPERVDAFSENNNTENARSYSDVMKEAELEREQQRIMKSIAEKKKESRNYWKSYN